MSIIASLYYNKEVDSEKRLCKKDLQETLMDVEITLLKAQMEGDKFVFCPIDYFLQVGLYDSQGKKIASNLAHDDIDFDKVMSNELHRPKGTVYL